MNETILPALYRDIKRKKTKGLSTESLTDLLQGYLSLHALVQTMPWEASLYDTPERLTRRIRSAAEELLARPDELRRQEPEAALQLITLTEAAQTLLDDDMLQETLNRAFERLYSGNRMRCAIPDPETVSLLCCCYYHTGDENCLETAREITMQWHNEQLPNGRWPGINDLTAITRLYAMAQFDTATDTGTFSLAVRQGTNHYAASVNSESGLKKTNRILKFLMSSTVLPHSRIPFEQWTVRPVVPSEHTATDTTQAAIFNLSACCLLFLSNL